MKSYKLIYFMSIILFLVSCEPKYYTLEEILQQRIDELNYHKNYDFSFLNELSGYYSVEKFYTEQALDLDFDSIKHTDLLQEFKPVSLYSESLSSVKIEYEYTPAKYVEYVSAAGNLMQGITHERFIRSFDIIMPCTWFDEYSGTILEKGYVNTQVSFYYFEENPKTQEITITYGPEQNSYLSNAELHAFGILKSIRYANSRLYLEYEKDFYTPQGWQTVYCFLEFVKTQSWGNLAE